MSLCLFFLGFAFLVCIVNNSSKDSQSHNVHIEDQGNSGDPKEHDTKSINRTLNLYG